MKSCHECEKLNKLLGKRVIIKFWNMEIEEGILGKSKYCSRYELATCYANSILFYKSHIISVTEI